MAHITLPPVTRCEEAKQLRSLRTRIKIISDRGASAGSGAATEAGAKNGWFMMTALICKHGSSAVWCAEYTAADAGVAEIPKS